jgi:hypothetical protein
VEVEPKDIINPPYHHECIQVRVLSYTNVTLINFTNAIVSNYLGTKIVTKLSLDKIHCSNTLQNVNSMS